MSREHISKITHEHLQNCKDALAIYAQADEALEDAVIRRKIESILAQHYFFALRELIFFLDQLMAGKFIASFDPPTVHLAPRRKAYPQEITAPAKVVLTDLETPIEGAHEEE